MSFKLPKRYSQLVERIQKRVREARPKLKFKEGDVKYPTIDEEILLLQEKSKDVAVSVEEIFQTLSGKGRSLILLFLSLPFCQPLQIPGLSTPFGLIIAFIGLRMAFGKRLWMPKWVLEQTIASDTLQKITEKTLWLVRKMRRWIHPRLTWLCHYPASQVANGLLISILGLILSLPLPIPFSNLIAAWSIFFIGLGLLEDNGVFVLIGYAISLFTFAIFIVMAISLSHIF